MISLLVMKGMVKLREENSKDRGESNLAQPSKILREMVTKETRESIVKSRLNKEARNVNKAIVVGVPQPRMLSTTNLSIDLQVFHGIFPSICTAPLLFSSE